MAWPGAPPNSLRPSIRRTGRTHMESDHTHPYTPHSLSRFTWSGAGTWVTPHPGSQPESARPSGILAFLSLRPWVRALRDRPPETREQPVPMVPDPHARLRAAIVGYARSHPHASDTVQGILGWWIPLGMEDAADFVEDVLDELVKEGRLRRHGLPDGSVLYSVIPHWP